MSKRLVQERVASYLIEELGVPEDMVEFDTPLDEYEEGVEGSIDLTVTYEDEDGLFAPLLTISCLDDDIEMTEEVIAVCTEKCKLIEEVTGVDRMIITNGDMMMYTDTRMTEVDGEENLPTYEVMVEQYLEDKALIDAHEEGCGCGCDCGSDCDCH